MSLKTNLLLFFAISLIGTISAQDFLGPKSEMAKIKSNITQFSQYYVNGEIDKLTNCYTTDGKIFPTGKNIIAGHEAIKKMWTLPAGVKILRHKISPEEIRIVDEYAYDYGYYAGATLGRDSSESTWQGKYVIVWKKVDDNWKIYLDIWNKVDLPKPATVTTAKSGITDHPEYGAVKAAIEDYVFGLYMVAPDRIVNSVDSTLHKTGFWYNKETMAYMDNLEMSYQQLVDLAKDWNKTSNQITKASPREITIFDIADKTASAKLVAVWGMDYFHLAKVAGKWKIRNVLWQSLPDRKEN